VTTPSYSELVSAVRREGEGILSTAGMGLDADVPPCPGWDLTDLLGHVARIYQFAALVLSSRATEVPDRPELPAGDPVDVLRDTLDDLVTALAECDAQTPVWNWAAGEPAVAAFWARRMAHESSVHRFDAQSAHGVVQPIDAELAADGLDELIDVIAPRTYSRHDEPAPTGTVALHAADGGVWCLALEPDGVQRLEVLSAPGVTVAGTTNALLLAAYNRVPWNRLEIEGDADLLARWSAAMSF
jgi:uncharacterized protein (TIGR03083 family)